jgi:hypothetical protein
MWCAGAHWRCPQPFSLSNSHLCEVDRSCSIELRTPLSLIGHSLRSLPSSTSLSGHEQSVNSSLHRIRAWQKVVDVRDAAIFYPFGGPDLLYPLSLFTMPTAVHLYGLERVGSASECVPLLDGRSLDVSEFYAEMTDLERSGWYHSYHSHSHRSNGSATNRNAGANVLSKEEQFASGRAACGLVPLLLGSASLADAAAAGHGGYDVRRVLWDDQSIRKVTVVLYDTLHEREVMASYTSCDLRQTECEAEATRHLSKGRTAALLKSGLYLLRDPSLGRIAQKILDHTCAVVQDDSGFKFRTLQDATAARQKTSSATSDALSVHGSYTGPLRTWKGHTYEGEFRDSPQSSTQPENADLQWQSPWSKDSELAEALRNQKHKHLPFRFGYHGTRGPMAVLHSGC